MSVGKRISEAFDRLVENDYEAATIPVSIAVAATASRCNPTAKDGFAYKEWLRINLGLITRVGMGNVSITDSFRFAFSHPDLKPDVNGLCTLEQLLYHVVRCGVVHQAEISPAVKFGPPGTTTFDNSTITLSAGFLTGMIFAVVVSPVNAGERSPKDSRIGWIDGRSLAVNDLWGDRQKLIDFLDATIYPLPESPNDAETR